MRDHAALLFNQFCGMFQKDGAVGVFPAWIVIGKEPANVSGRHRAQHGVNQRVSHGIGVRVAGQTGRVRNGDATQHQRTTLDKAVRVVADADSDHAATVADLALKDRLAPPKRQVVAAPRRPKSGPVAPPDDVQVRVTRGTETAGYTVAKL